MIILKQFWHNYQKQITYLIFGVLTTLVNLITFYFLTHYLAVYYLWATILAWVIAVFFAFITNKLWVFTAKKKTPKAFFIELWLFFAFRGLSLLIDLMIMFIGVTICSYSEFPVKLVAQIIVVIANYLFSLFIFESEVYHG